MKESITSLIAILMLSISFVQAQSLTESSPVAAKPQEIFVAQYLHHAAWGLSLASGGQNLGRDAGDAMISMLYAYRYAPTNEVELSLNYMPVQRLHELDGRAFPDSIPYTSLTWIADVSFFFQPFSGIFQDVRIGVGPSFAMQSFMMKSRGQSAALGQYVDSNGVRVFVPRIVIPPYPDTGISQSLGIGLNIKVEYLIPIAKNVDLAIRAQLQPFIPAGFSSSVGNALGGGGGSIGGFLRVGW